jgi:flagellar motor switch protein FliN
MDEAEPENPPEEAAVAAEDAPPAQNQVPAPVNPLEVELSSLPAFARGLLKIRVPLHVTLASQRKSIHEIVELGPGSIIKFDKTCDEPHDLSIGDRAIALGEVVKIGDKFGLRISGILK